MSSELSSVWLETKLFNWKKILVNQFYREWQRLGVADSMSIPEQYIRWENYLSLWERALNMDMEILSEFIQLRLSPKLSTTSLRRAYTRHAAGGNKSHININSLWSVQFILTASWLCQSTTDIVTAPLRLKSSDSDPVLVTILQPIWAFQLLSSCMKCFDFFTLSKFSCFVRVSSNKKILNYGFLISI